MTQIHFVEKLRKQKKLDKESYLYESGNWVVSKEKAKQLIGSRIYFHLAQSDPSYFGGEIKDFYVLPPEHTNADRVVFIFMADKEGKDVFAGTDGWKNDQKTI